jgi:putative ABC transport system ATP-binding protein
MIQVQNLEYSYGQSSFRLSIPALHVSQGERVALIGPSGSGKTTLLSLLSGAVVPTSGSIEVDGVRVDTKSDAERRRFRIAKVGFVFQDFELIEYLPVRDNILLPYFINRSLKRTAETDRQLERITDQAGLSDKLRRYPQQLSTGERQRVAICRALIASPRLVLADEPTGSLDPITAGDIMKLLLDQATVNGATLVMVTHDHGLLGNLDRTIDFGQATPNARTGRKP